MSRPPQAKSDLLFLFVCLSFYREHSYLFHFSAIVFVTIYKHLNLIGCFVPFLWLVKRCGCERAMRGKNIGIHQ